MVSAPNVPSNSRRRFAAAVRSASRWSMLRPGWCSCAVSVMAVSGEVDGGCQPVDPVGDVGEDLLEGVVGVDAGRVGHRPVQPVTGLAAEFFVGVVTDRDNEVVVVQDVLDTRGARPCQGQAAAARDRHGTRMHPSGRMSARRGRRHRTVLRPQRRRPLRPGTSPAAYPTARGGSDRGSLEKDPPSAGTSPAAYRCRGPPAEHLDLAWPGIGRTAIQQVADARTRFMSPVSGAGSRP